MGNVGIVLYVVLVLIIGDIFIEYRQHRPNGFLDNIGECAFVRPAKLHCAVVERLLILTGRNSVFTPPYRMSRKHFEMMLFSKVLRYDVVVNM